VSGRRMASMVMNLWEKLLYKYSDLPL
jgi:hypothetical protein